MAELEYNITANVTGAEEVSALKDDLGTIAENPTVTVDATGLQDAATASGDLATGLGDSATAATDSEAPLESAGGIAEIFGGKLNIASLRAIGMAGAMNIVTGAIDLGRKAWEAYNAKQAVTDETTRSVSAALTDQAGALGGVLDALNEIAGTEAATPVERLTAAITEGIDPEELSKIVSALGVVNLQLTDLPPTLNAIEQGGDGALETMTQLAEQSGIPPEFAEGIARAVLESEDLTSITEALVPELNLSNAAAEELAGTYGTQIGALEQLNDAQQNIDLEKIATDQLEVARGTDTATAALVAQAQAEVGPDASQLDVWSRYAELQATATSNAEEQAAAAALQAQELQEAADGAIAFNNAIGSVDFKTADIAAGASAMDTYTTGLFAAGNQAQTTEAAFDALAASAEGQALTFDVGTESGRAQQDALEGVARALDTDLAQAYVDADGNQATFMATATTLGEETLARLQDELGLTDEQVAAVGAQLGLTEGDYEARFTLAGAAEAQAQLGILGDAIAGLPADVETTVTQLILTGDYVAARDTVAAYYTANPVPVPTEVDESGATAGITDKVLNVPMTKTILTEADLSAYFDSVDEAVAEENVATITGAAELADAGADLDALVDQERIAIITAEARTGPAAADLYGLESKERTAVIDVATGTIDLPSRFDLAASIGTVRVPVQVYWNTRIEGRRPI